MGFFKWLGRILAGVLTAVAIFYVMLFLDPRPPDDAPERQRKSVATEAAEAMDWLSGNCGEYILLAVAGGAGGNTDVNARWFIHGLWTAGVRPKALPSNVAGLLSGSGVDSAKLDGFFGGKQDGCGLVAVPARYTAEFQFPQVLLTGQGKSVAVVPPPGTSFQALQRWRAVFDMLQDNASFRRETDKLPLDVEIRSGS